MARHPLGPPVTVAAAAVVIVVRSPAPIPVVARVVHVEAVVAFWVPAVRERAVGQKIVVRPVPHPRTGPAIRPRVRAAGGEEGAHTGLVLALEPRQVAAARSVGRFRSIQRVVRQLLLRVGLDPWPARLRDARVALPAAPSPLGVVPTCASEEAAQMGRKPVPVVHPLDVAAGEPPPDTGVPHERLITPVGILVAGGRPDAPVRQGPMGPCVTVGPIGPTLGRPAAAPAPRPGAGRLEVPDGVVTSPVAPAEGAAHQGVATVPAVPSSAEIGGPVGVVPLVVMAAEVADGAAPPSLGRARGLVATAAAPAGGRAPAEAPTAPDGAGAATAAGPGPP